MNVSRALVARALSCLLLTSLAFSATFGVVHRHGLAPTRRAAAESSNVNSVGPSDSKDSSTDGPLQSKDCSICQLHQHLSGGLLYGPVFTPAPPAEHVFESVASVPYHSATAAPRRGRAPPQATL
jgi:hypothetical protein